MSDVLPQITEGAISYNVQLGEVEGGGRLADQNTVSVVTIRQNDDPIFFNDILLSANEGTNLTLALMRGGQASGM